MDGTNGSHEQPTPPTDDDAGGIILFDGLERAIVGFGRQYGCPPVAVYSETAIVQILMDRDGLTVEEAVEMFDFNVKQLWTGPQTPLILEDT